MAIFAHPDDEIGCVGTLKKHAERGDAVMLVWTTLGELASQFGDQSHAQVTATRQQHGAWVAERIGAQHRFFDMGDSRLTAAREQSLALARLYAEWKPDAILTWDDHHPHPDHRATARMAFDAITLARIPKIVNEGRTQGERLEAHRAPVRFYQYYTKASPYPSVHVDVSGQVETMREVFEFYHAFYRWNFTAEQYLAQRALTGREAGVASAEHFQVRGTFAPATDYLR